MKDHRWKQPLRATGIDQRGCAGSIEDWIQLGQDLQLIWFGLTEQKLVMQPFANNLIIYNYLKDQRLHNFSAKNKSCIEKWFQTLGTELGIHADRPGILFRIGHPQSQAPKSPRKSLIANFDHLLPMEGDQ